MTAPVWMNAVISDFGRAAGLDSFALNERGAAALRFETGYAFRLEYTGRELVMSMTGRVADVKRLLSSAHPLARHGLRVRAGILPKTRESFVAVRMPERDVTLPHLNSTFGVLWRIAGEIGGSAWA